MSHAISELKRGVNAQILSEASKFLGESEENLSNGLGGIFAVLLSAVMKRADAPDSSAVFQQLDRLVKMVPNRDEMLNNSSKILSSLKGEGELGGIASKFLSLNLGDKTQDVIALVSKALGLKEASVSSLFNMAAPMVLGWFGHKAQEDNLSAQGLVSYLHSQSDFIGKALPQGLGSMLGLGTLGGASASAIRETVNETKCSGGACLKWLLLLLVLLVAAFFIWKSCSTQNAQEQITEVVAVPAQTVADSAGQVADQVQASAEATVDAAQNVWAYLGDFFTITLPDGTVLNIPELGVEKKLLMFIQDDSQGVDRTTWFSFDRLLFETNSATLKPDSAEQLANIAAILTAYPDVKIKIGGYTDNTGSSEFNMSLSEERAMNVRQELMALGINGDRIEAEGYGETHPVASNDTEEGRAQNRRIDLRVTAK